MRMDPLWGMARLIWLTRLIGSAARASTPMDLAWVDLDMLFLLVPPWTSTLRILEPRLAAPCLAPIMSWLFFAYASLLARSATVYCWVTGLSRAADLSWVSFFCSDL